MEGLNNLNIWLKTQTIYTSWWFSY